MRHVMSAKLFASLCLFPTLVAACGGSDPTSPDPVATTSVSVLDDVFAPANILVDPGATVTWTWAGDNPHRIRWVSAGLGDSPLQTTGAHQQAMPQGAGTYAYYCTEHGTPTSGMRGSVIVE
jgi:plastocyanin